MSSSPPPTTTKSDEKSKVNPSVIELASQQPHQTSLSSKSVNGGWQSERDLNDRRTMIAKIVALLQQVRCPKSWKGAHLPSPPFPSLPFPSLPCSFSPLQNRNNLTKIIPSPTLLPDAKTNLDLQRKPNAPKEWLDKLPQMAKRLEESLYRTASCFESYNETATLKARLQQLAMNIGMKTAQAREAAQREAEKKKAQGGGDDNKKNVVDMSKINPSISAGSDSNNGNGNGNSNNNSTDQVSLEPRENISTNHPPIFLPP